jgi:hypothetical protein
MQFQTIQLSKLVPSPENVRKTNTKDGIEGLAEVSELAGFPPLRIMEGFWADGLIKPTLENLPITGKFATDHLIREY